jgi:hypothetical protein
MDMDDVENIEFRALGGVLPQRRMLPSKPPLPHRNAPVASCSRPKILFP